MSSAARRSTRLALTCLVLQSGPLAAQVTPAPRPQNPSPMVERTRAHERVHERQVPGLRLEVKGVLSRPAHVFVPAGVDLSRGVSLLVHFHGAPYVAEHAIAIADPPWIAVVVNLGAGTGVYEGAFEHTAVFDSLLLAVSRRLHAESGGAAIPPDRIVVSAYSAGHGAVRALVRHPRQGLPIAGALLLDGIHTGYVPAGTVLHEGGRLDTSGLDPFVELAAAAVRGALPVLITHSEVFPGTFASTTETTDHLLDALGLRRTAVLRWGPGGMQQLSEVRSGRLLVQGFAGNSAPDHADHLHGLAEFLRLLDEL